MNPVLDLRHLRALAAIAETGGVTRAGERLHLTQSALSHQLRDAEDKLGTPLFLRIRKKMVLTPAGEKLLQSAHRVLAELERAEEDIGGIHGGLSGVIRLCTECYTCYHWLPGALRQIRKEYPEMELRIVTVDTPDPLKGLLEGRLDLAIVSSPVKQPGIVAEALFEDEMVLVLPQRHSLARVRYVDPKWLDGASVLIYPPQEESYLIHRLMAPAGAQPGQVIELPLTEAILECVQAGLGVALVARWALIPYLRTKRVVAKRITEQGYHRQWSAATLAERPLTVVGRKLVQMLRAPGTPVRYVRGTAAAAD